MRGHEIPSADWVPFFNELSRKHHGEHVTVEFGDRNIAGKNEGSDQSLLNISVDPPTGACKIEVSVGAPATASISHEISHPIHVRLTQRDDGKDAAVEIETDAGPYTMLRFDA
jgi:hypothetical protein